MAVDPVLASTLWAAHQANDSEQASKRGKLSTGCGPIDKALHGGLEYGKIHCISAESDSGEREVCYAFLKSHLLTAEQADATFIDTTNSFDVRRLHATLVAELRESKAAGDISAQAVQALGRVRITKAFDFVGLTESIAELRDDLEYRRHASFPERPPNSQAAPGGQRGTVGDSEDEEEDILDKPVENTAPTADQEDQARPASAQSSPGLVIIDNIAQVATPLLKSNHAQGQALLTSFMRSLRHLARAQHLCTIIFNSASTYSKSTAAEAASIFSSCLSRPALGRSFAYFVDTHMLLHTLPLAAEDANAVYGTQTGTLHARVKTASVLEVLQDRHGTRVGRWAAFSVDAERKLNAIT